MSKLNFLKNLGSKIIDLPNSIAPLSPNKQKLLF